MLMSVFVQNTVDMIVDYALWVAGRSLALVTRSEKNSILVPEVRRQRNLSRVRVIPPAAVTLSRTTVNSSLATRQQQEIFFAKVILATTIFFT